MTYNPSEMTDDALVGARDALQNVDDEVYKILIRKSNRIEVAIDVNTYMSAVLAETQAELHRRRSARAQNGKET